LGAWHSQRAAVGVAGTGASLRSLYRPGDRRDAALVPRLGRGTRLVARAVDRCIVHRDGNGNRQRR
jgi:hypothetical protein